MKKTCVGLLDEGRGKIGSDYVARACRLDDTFTHGFTRRSVSSVFAQRALDFRQLCCAFAIVLWSVTGLVNHGL